MKKINWDYFWGLVFFGLMFISICKVMFVDVEHRKPPTNGEFLWLWIWLLVNGLFVIICLLRLVSKDTPESDVIVATENTTDFSKPKPKNLKTDNPEDNEIITVTEIKGERNIIIDVVVKIIVFIIGLVLTGIFTSLCGGIIGFLPLTFAIMYCFKTNDKNKD